MTELMTPWPGGHDDHHWPETPDPALRGGAPYARLHAAQRLLQDRLAGATPPNDVTLQVTEQLEALSALLAGHQAPEAQRWDGWRPDLPGRGLPLVPPYVVDHEEAGLLRGHVTFSRFHLGGNGAAHGGTQPLLFDDLLGRVVNAGQDGVARTAYLHVNFRRVTPLDVALRWEVSLDRIDGRKRYASGRLTDANGTVLADCEALFVRLAPGQP